jgi:anti-sigma regulatory factor (Ser/Thr protein kinase)
MVTERSINALSHAYPRDQSDGTVVVTYELGELNWSLTVSDNGLDCPTQLLAMELVHLSSKHATQIELTILVSRELREPSRPWP